VIAIYPWYMILSVKISYYLRFCLNYFVVEIIYVVVLITVTFTEPSKAKKQQSPNC
jgi:hypothetical protein